MNGSREAGSDSGLRGSAGKTVIQSGDADGTEFQTERTRVTHFHHTAVWPDSRELLEVLSGAHGVGNDGALALDHVKLNAHARQGREDIREEDDAVGAESTQWLKRQLNGDFGSLGAHAEGVLVRVPRDGDRKVGQVLGMVRSLRCTRFDPHPPMHAIVL